MKEHEDEVMQSVDKSTVAFDSTGVDKVVSETLGDGEGKSIGFLSEKDQEEDVMVDVVGSDVVEDDIHGRTEANLDGKSGSEELGMRKETVTRDQDMVDVAGSGEDCDASVGIRVLSSDKAEVVVNEEEVGGSGEDCDASVETRVLASEKVLIPVASRSNGDIDVTDSKELTEIGLTEEVVKVNVESVEVVADGKIVESSVLAANLGSLEVDLVVEDGVSVDPSLVGANNQSSATEVVNSRTVEVDESNKEDDCLHSTSKVTTDDAHDITDGDCAVNEKIEKQNEVLVSSKVSEPLTATDPSSKDVDVVIEDGLAGKDDEGQDVISVDPSLVTEVVNSATGNGVMGEKTGKEDEILDSSKIPESLTTVSPRLTCEDADMDRGENAGMDIDGVPAIDVTSDAEKGQHFNVIANAEANVEQKLLESSSGPVLIQHREEPIKSREPIVYGRRVHVEVPLYESVDLEQKLPESSSPVSEDENLKIETDSEEDDDDDNDDDDNDDDEQKVDRRNSELLENGNLVSLHQPRYFKPPENEGEFSVSDLVWGKIRSHPWWPGQIIDPSYASKKAMKYYKKDSFLVAYFGDHSFAWNNSSVLKPFRANFSQNEKQINTEIFKTALDCALEEVSRRVELGLACSCVPKETYKKIEYQVIDNAGIAKKSNKRYGNDESASVSSFEPDKLVDYVRLLAQFPAQCDKMDVVITKAQLSSYGHYKGYRELPEFLFCGDLLEDAPVHEEVEKVYKNGEKIENNLIENANPNKEIILSDVTDDAPESVGAGGTSKLVSSAGLKKRKARVSISNGSVKRPNRPLNKVASAPVSTPKPSFKVGALIQRVASQLAGPVLKSDSDPKVDHGQHADQIVQTPENPQMEASASVAEMLSQLHLTAQDPMKEYGFFQTIIPFFYERRAAVFSKSLKKSSTVEKPDSETKKKAPSENDPEEFEFDFNFDFDDVNDSYWTDRIIHNHSEDQPLQDTQNGAVEEYPVVEHEPDKPAKRRRRTNKKQKQVISRDHEPEPIVEEESEIVRKRRENLATEVVLKFEEGINFCSESQLNRMFRRFGSLMESETEVDRNGGRARVVFKRCFDAEVAHNSAGRFNIFGSVNVSYELNYSPLVSYKPLPLPLPLLQEDQMDHS